MGIWGGLCLRFRVQGWSLRSWGSGLADFVLSPGLGVGFCGWALRQAAYLQVCMFLRIRTTKTTWVARGIRVSFWHA